MREGRSPQQIGRKGLSNHRWIVGGKLCLLLNQWGLVVAWACATANVADNTFQWLIRPFEERMIILSDTAFHAAEGDPTNLKLCQRGEWQDRMLVETVLSMLTLVSHFKKAMPRVWAYFRARLAFAMAASAGGIEALWHIFGALPADLPAVLAVVQHRSPREGSLLATVLKQCSQIAVHDAVSEECLQPGRIALAPANHHLLVTPDGSFALFDTVA